MSLTQSSVCLSKVFAPIGRRAGEASKALSLLPRCTRVSRVLITRNHSTSQRALRGHGPKPSDALSSRVATRLGFALKGSVLTRRLLLHCCLFVLQETRHERLQRPIVCSRVAVFSSHYLRPPLLSAREHPTSRGAGSHKVYLRAIYWEEYRFRASITPRGLCRPNWRRGDIVVFSP